MAGSARGGELYEEMRVDTAGAVRAVRSLPPSLPPSQPKAIGREWIRVGDKLTSPFPRSMAKPYSSDSHLSLSDAHFRSPSPTLAHQVCATGVPVQFVHGTHDKNVALQVAEFLYKVRRTYGRARDDAESAFRRLSSPFAEARTLAPSLSIGLSAAATGSPARSARGTATRAGEGTSRIEGGALRGVCTAGCVVVGRDRRPRRRRRWWCCRCPRT
jgi:hypothetical protein